MGAQVISMDNLIATLEAFAERDFPVQEVHRFLTESRLAEGELEPYLFWDPSQYTRNLIHKSDDFELLVICWSPGQAAPIHGHEGEKCWARVEQGRLRFTNYLERRDGSVVKLELISEAVGGPGHLDGPADIHAVENVSGERAVTLHIYSKPYEACDIYLPQEGRKERRKLSYYSRYGKREHPARESA